MSSHHENVHLRPPRASIRLAFLGSMRCDSGRLLVYCHALEYGVWTACTRRDILHGPRMTCRKLGLDSSSQGRHHGCSVRTRKIGFGSFRQNNRNRTDTAVKRVSEGLRRGMTSWTWTNAAVVSMSLRSTSTAYWTCYGGVYQPRLTSYYCILMHLIWTHRIAIPAGMYPRTGSERRGPWPSSVSG